MIPQSESQKDDLYRYQQIEIQNKILETLLRILRTLELLTEEKQ